NESPYKRSDATNLLAPEANAAKTDFLTPTKQKTTSEIYYTPSHEKNHVSLFKTPGIPVSQKKFQTPSTKRSFQHVVSPVATYINKCPVVPLVKDVRPKKPLVATSSIPKPIKSVLKANNKENVKLPSFAYKAAKETKMIDIPDEGKLPQNQWAKQLVSSIPRATVIKHDHREGSLKKPLKHHQEDSFADLSMHQADVSVCTQKCAFNKPKKLL
ncbi:uncharacterized protein LOC113229339, partial [Hyposmocoma kahamanoa]|uniref:uncharacterized protein LOC113229339 n=1 Tax=Hyposmocoma kahamanoa TaxID=1477025 RepID=UPI000E6D646B